MAVIHEPNNTTETFQNNVGYGFFYSSGHARTFIAILLIAKIVAKLKDIHFIVLGVNNISIRP